MNHGQEKLALREHWTLAQADEVGMKRHKEPKA
jgi:hypothetical protein